MIGTQGCPRCFDFFRFSTRPRFGYNSHVSRGQISFISRQIGMYRTAREFSRLRIQYVLMVVSRRQTISSCLRQSAGITGESKGSWGRASEQACSRPVQPSPRQRHVSSHVRPPRRRQYWSSLAVGIGSCQESVLDFTGREAVSLHFCSECRTMLQDIAVCPNVTLA